ncbi:Hypothetical predicted protein [Pelobates cultripes]|uniref:Uncharacterized protein n=1 Tax=Pelobates cultripes TaxID=61616 RepID=A0AAD1RRX3_PELCU|nr:Hypothetical predicted protein [Pelobates cultripes]
MDWQGRSWSPPGGLPTSKHACITPGTPNMAMDAGHQTHLMERTGVLLRLDSLLATFMQNLQQRYILLTMSFPLTRSPKLIHRSTRDRVTDPMAARLQRRRPHRQHQRAMKHKHIQRLGNCEPGTLSPRSAEVQRVPRQAK